MAYIYVANRRDIFYKNLFIFSRDAKCFYAFARKISKKKIFSKGITCRYFRVKSYYTFPRNNNGDIVIHSQFTVLAQWYNTHNFTVNLYCFQWWFLMATTALILLQPISVSQISHPFVLLLWCR